MGMKLLNLVSLACVVSISNASFGYTVSAEGCHNCGEPLGPAQPCYGCGDRDCNFALGHRPLSTWLCGGCKREFTSGMKIGTMQVCTADRTHCENITWNDDRRRRLEASAKRAGATSIRHDLHLPKCSC